MKTIYELVSIFMILTLLSTGIGAATNQTTNVTVSPTPIANGSIGGTPTISVGENGSDNGEGLGVDLGAWYQGDGGIYLMVGQTSVVNLNSLKIVSNAYISAGCADGETMSGYIEYFDGSSWHTAQYFTGAGCGSSISFPQVTASSLRLTMTSGGGVDNIISWYSQGSNGWRVYATDKQHPVKTLNAVRTIDGPTLAAGSYATVTVVIHNNGAAQALSLKETIPSGWTVTQISSDADQFKASTNEWIWLATIANTVKTVKYKVTVPYGTTPGIYNINGYVTTSTGTTGVTGDNVISVIVAPPVSASRTIDNTVLFAGSSTGITVVIQNYVTQSLSLKETIPQGWILTRVDDDADQFKASTNEWVWLTTIGGTTKTVKYIVTNPYGTTSGTYSINGLVTTSGTNINVLGANVISVKPGDILACYRGLGKYPNIVETSDLLKAADDWRNNVNCPCFPAVITTMQLLELADEWRNS